MTDYRKAAVVQLAWIGPPALAHKLLLLEHLTSLACPIVFLELCTFRKKNADTNKCTPQNSISINKKLHYEPNP